MVWQSITTAPKDGTEIIYLWQAEGQIGRCAWQEGTDEISGWWDTDGDQPAHADFWIPKPSLPIRR